MAHFAQIDSEDRVIQVVVVEQAVIDQGVLGDPQAWIQCSYNTAEGRHYLGGQPLRANYPGPGWIYNRQLDIFHPPKPPGTATLNPVTGQWDRPKPRPTLPNIYQWNEELQDWEII